MISWFDRAMFAALLTGAVVATAPVAEAGYTAVKPPTRKSDASHEQILERVYGGDFVADPTGLSFSNASGVTVTRLEDGPAADDAWAGKSVLARAVAAFPGRRKTAGYFGTSSAAQSQRLFDASGRHFDVSGAAQGAVPADGALVFGKGRGKAARTFSSVAGSNRDGMDHLVAYEVKGASGQPASLYLLCWEDKFGRKSDRDYNDLVVEVQAAEAAAKAFSQPLLIPLPPPAWTGLGGLLGLATASILRRRPPGRLGRRH